MAAITGLGMAGLVRRQTLTATQLALEAVDSALLDAGLELRDIDGLYVSRSHVAEDTSLGLGLAAMAGLHDLSALQYVDGEGTSALQQVMNAAMAVTAGLCRHVVCVYSDAPLRTGLSSSEAFNTTKSRGGMRDLRYRSGAFGGAAVYAFAARRHMALYGTREEDFGAVATSARAWASRSPHAIFREPMSMTDYLASRRIAEPLRLFDCAVPVDGAIAVVVSAPDAARTLRQPPVNVLGFGQGHPGWPRQAPFEPDVTTGAAIARQKAFEMAGVGLADIDMAQFYDAFTLMTLVALEEYGFCKKGQAGAFVREGNIAPGGKLPVNTGGGHLSGYYVQGMTPISEAVMQLRGQAGDRQCANARVALVTNEGGHFDHHACAVLGAA